ncbi:MAG: PP2C family protein-serine/threonine phosphatase [bacterium]|nr:PP2C family protein-serine/threonine phosphatase [bacterium]
MELDSSGQPNSIDPSGETTEMLLKELDNFQDIARYIKPSSGEIPKLNGVDIFGDTIPLNGILGGDHIIYLDFKRRYDLVARIQKARDRNHENIIPELEKCRTKTGIVVADVSGHQITDALLAAMLHQAFLLGAMYEMDYYGNITEKLFENLNTRFYNSSSVSKFLTMIYGEISENGQFEFLSAGHPMPFVYSKKDERLVDFPEDKLISFPPIGTLPSQRDIDRRTQNSVLGFKEEYEVNHWNLMGDGDILIIYTDGFIEHQRGEELYAPRYLEKKLHDVKDLSSKEIFDAIKTDLLAFAKPEDDISFVVIKWH